MRILQLNAHCSPDVLHSLLNTPASNAYDIICVQEPFAVFNNMVSHPNWSILVDPANVAWSAASYSLGHTTALPERRRTVIYANRWLSANDIQVIGINHPDIIAIQVRLASQAEPLLLCNIYNPPNTSNTIPPLAMVLESY